MRHRRLADCPDFNSVLEKASFRHEVVQDDAIRLYCHFPGRPPQDVLTEEAVVSASFSGRGGYVEYSNKFVRISQSFFLWFDGLQKALQAKAKAV